MTDITQGQDEQAEQEQDSPETVQLAKDMGWKSPEEWRGEPPKSGFVSASEYVRRSEKILPIVNARARKAEEEAAKLRNELDTTRREHRDTIGRIERMSTVALEQQRSQIEARYAERIDAAAEVGDKAAVQQARKDEKEALKALDAKLEPTEAEKKTAATERAELPKAMQETIATWKADNAWFSDDPNDEMSGVANHYHSKLLREKKGLTLAENLAEVTKYIRKRYPEEFSAASDDEGDDDGTPRRKGSPVEGGGSRMNGGGQRSLYSKLPADAKAQADKFIKDDGLFLQKGETVEKNLAQARERYAKEYLGDQA